MVVEDVLDDRQPEPGAAHLARAGRVDAVEPLRQTGQVLARYALAAIAHRYRDKGVGPAALKRPRDDIGVDRDLGPAAAVFDSVVDEVLENLGEFVASAEHIRKIGRQCQADAHPALCSAQLVRLGHLGQERNHIHPVLRH